jgi:regulation of enolase protein 1 (concanavalin A-like superfamily)
VLSVNVLTYHNDNLRTGLNPQETVLTPQNVNTTTFGKLFEDPVDGQVFAQPLVVTNVTVPGQGRHDLVIVATENDSVYAFDAAQPDAVPLWHTSFIDPAQGITAVPGSATNGNIQPEVGITGTPVIDAATGTIYVVAATAENRADGTHYVQRLHALDISTGADKLTPFVIGDTMFDGSNYTDVTGVSVPGTGDGSVNGVVSFNALRESQRPALLLLNGAVYVGWASHGDNGPYHGWVIGFNAQTLQPVAGAVYNDTPNGSEAGIWMSGAGLAADNSGNIYFSTGNGTFDANVGGTDYGDSAVKLSTYGGLSVADYFTPSNQLFLQQNDLDFGSGGVMLLPDQPGFYPHLLVMSYKLGTLEVINRDNMGRFNPTTDNVVQELPGALGGTWNSPAYFDGTIYFNSVGDVLKAFHLFASDATTALSTAPVSQASNPIGYPGDTPSISASGTNHGIVWTLQTDGFGSGSPAVLHAYDASDVSRELYNSSQAGTRDVLAPAVEFTVPTIANGHVYVAGAGGLVVLGLLPAGGRPTVFNTGVDASGNALPVGTVDPHYTLVSSPDPSAPGPQAYVYDTSSLPYIPDTPAAAWISSTIEPSESQAVGVYDYQATVDLTNFRPSTAVLTGYLSTDNELRDILVNGVSTGINNGATDTSQFQSFTPYYIKTGFRAGINTLDFLVNNDGGPTGLFNSMTMTARPAIPPPSLPGGFSQGDVGGVGFAGRAVFNQGTFSLYASGDDIFNNADAFHYVYQSMQGDGTIVARVDSVAFTSFYAKAGVMIRETMDPGSMNAMMEITAGGQSFFQWRDTSGGSTSAVQGPDATVPSWVKLVRTGSVLTGYESADGQTWTEVGSAPVPMSANVYVGLAATAQNNAAITTATFDQVALSTAVNFGDVAINAGGGAAGSFLADTDFTVDTGATFSVSNPIGTVGVVGPAPQAVYQSERYGVFTYTIPGLTPGALYNVRMHFAEIFFNSPGQREFNVAINGRQVLTNFDVDSAAGGPDQAIVEPFLARADSQGRMIVQFTLGVADLAKLSGIEVLRADGGGESISALGGSFQATAGESSRVEVASISATGNLSSAGFTATILWGDGRRSAGVVQAAGSGALSILGDHRYAAAGLYVTTVNLFDRNDNIFEVVRGTANVAAAPGKILVSVGYYDDEHPNPTLPNPWNGSPNITFWGGTTDGLFDTGAILIQNISAAPVVIGPGLMVDNFANDATYQLWDSFIGSGFTLPPGQSLIAAQTAGRDFDTSDTPVLNDPSQRNSFTPLIHITVDGQALVYIDSAQVLNTGGFDPGQSENVSESAPWQVVGQVPQKPKAPATVPAGSTATNVGAAVSGASASGAAGGGVLVPLAQTATATIAPLFLEARAVPVVGLHWRNRRLRFREFAHERGRIRTASHDARRDLRASTRREVKAGALVRRFVVARQSGTGTRLDAATPNPYLFSAFRSTWSLPRGRGSAGAVRAPALK